MKIYAPVKDANGVYASVRFVNGVGETNNPHLIEWFRSHGYKVVQDSAVSVDDRSSLDKVLEDVESTTEPDFDSMTPNELRDWMKENGLGDKVKNTRNKEKLLQIIRG